MTQDPKYLPIYRRVDARNPSRIKFAFSLILTVNAVPWKWGEDCVICRRVHILLSIMYRGIRTEFNDRILTRGYRSDFGIEMTIILCIWSRESFPRGTSEDVP